VNFSAFSEGKKVGSGWEEDEVSKEARKKREIAMV
jgi:hypothetical protein